MAGDLYFPKVKWLGREIGMSDARNPFNGSLWRVTEKLDEAISPMTEHQMKEYDTTPAIHGDFRCVNVHNPNMHAIMKIDMQFPYIGSEHRESEFRKEQASSVHNYDLMEQLVALGRLTAENCPYTPRLLAMNLQIQNSDDAVVPGGWLMHRVVTETVGEALGTGFVKKKEGRRVHEGLFWDLPPVKRTLIREQLEVAYKAAYAAKVSLPRNLESLFWDENSHRLCIDGRMDPCGKPYLWKGFPWNVTLFGSFGLAQKPIGWNNPANASDLTIEDLEAEGWKF